MANLNTTTYNDKRYCYKQKVYIANAKQLDNLDKISQLSERVILHKTIL